MTMTHHPGEETLLDHVNGHLEPAFGLVIDAHVEMCTQCRETSALLHDVGGAYLLQEAPMEMQMSASELLEMAGAQADHVHAVQSPENKPGLPQRLAGLLAKPLEKLRWQWLSPDLKQYLFKLEGGANARLLWIAPGKSVPPHGHNGPEMTLILAGGYHDGPTAYTAGDFHFADHGSPHMPVAMDDQPCLVLAATDQPLKFVEWIPRLLQPMFRI